MLVASEELDRLNRFLSILEEKSEKPIIPNDLAGARHEDEQLSEKIAAAYQLGLADKEKQMMSEAVEGTVYGNGVYTWVAGDIPSQFKYGDKVRVIVLPKED